MKLFRDLKRRTEEAANGLKPQQPFTNSAPSMFDGLQGRTKELVKDLRFVKDGKPQPSITSAPSMFDGLQGRTKELIGDLRFAKEGNLNHLCLMAYKVGLRNL